MSTTEDQVKTMVDNGATLQVTAVGEEEEEEKLGNTSGNNAHADKRKEFLENNDTTDVLKVALHTYVLALSNIDSLNQSFQVRLEVWWRKEMSAMEVELLKKDPINFEPLAVVPIYPLKCKEILEREPLKFNNLQEFAVEWCDKWKCYIVTGAWLLNLVLTETMELDNFPFDVQHFDIVLQCRCDVNDPKNGINEFLVDENISTYNVPFSVLQLTGWYWEGLEFRPNLGERETVMRFKLRRDWTFYFWRVVVVLSVLTFLSFGVFSFNGNETADRMGHVSTMLLTAVAYMFVTQSHLPPLDHLTLLDKYVFFAFLEIFTVGATIIGQELIGGWALHRRADGLLFLIHLCAWIVGHIVFAGIGYFAKQKENAKILKYKEEVDGGDLWDMAWCNVSNERNDGYVTLKNQKVFRRMNKKSYLIAQALGDDEAANPKAAENYDDIRVEPDDN